MGHGLGAAESVLSDKIPRPDRIHGVVEDLGKPELLGRDRRVERQAAAGDRSGAERRHVKAPPHVPESVHVTQSHPAIGKKMGSQGDRLGLLEVGVRRHDDVLQLLGPVRHEGLQRQ